MRRLIFCLLWIPLSALSVVIPTTEKDLPILELCIESVKKYVADVDRIVVVSKEPLTDQAEWFSEEAFPFSKEEVGEVLALQDHFRLGWYYQQLLKLYAPFVIDGLENDVLILDSDTIWLRPISFINEKGIPQFAVAPNKVLYPSYYDHMARLHPMFRGIQWNFSPILHHIVLQKDKLEILFHVVESFHQMPFWEAFLRCCEFSCQDETDVTREEWQKLMFGASEYAIYFAFMERLFPRSMRVVVPRIDNDLTCIEELSRAKENHCDMASCHSWRRKP